MNLSSLFETLKTRDIKITLHGEQLKINAPKGVITPELQAEIAAHKQEIIGFLRGFEANTRLREKPVRRHEYGSTLPLSFAQQRMWFLDQLNPNHSAYVLSYGNLIPTRLDEHVLEQCLTEVVRRHEILRTSFHTQEDRPVQVVHPPTNIRVKVEDLSGLEEQAIGDRLQSMFDQECALPFDLSQAPLLRVSLYHLGQTGDFLLVNMHHIIGDNTSMINLSRELSALYPVSQLGHPSPLADLHVQYGDYVFWQQEVLQGSYLDDQIAYWMHTLGGDVPRLELPTDHPAAENLDMRAGQQILRLTPELSKELEGLAQRQSVTLFNLLLAALKVLLYRLSGQEDLTVGTPVWGRSRPELEPMIGLFLNTLALRTDLSGNPSFVQAVQRVNETTSGAFSHQDVPFERLVEELEPDRSLSRHPFFDIFVNFVQPKNAARDDQAFALDPIISRELESHFAITIYIAQTSDQLLFNIVYRKALYSVERMCALADQFQFLLEQISQDPVQRIDEYSLVTPAARKCLPDPADPLCPPEQEPVYAFVEHWAKTQPDLTAIEQNGRGWSYRELTEAARSLAAGLCRAGCKQGEVVAVSGQTSFGLVASLLGVLQSGGILLTLDPALPPRRQETMLQEAKAHWFIQVADADSPAPPFALRGDVTCLQVVPETGWLRDAPPAGNDQPFESPVRPDDPAYIFFTSGTTNVPKGVLGTQRGLSHFLTWQRETFQIGPGHRAAQLTALSFDVVLRDIFTPLISGACLCLPDSAAALASEALLLWLQQENIDLLHTVPAIALTWLNLASPGLHLGALRWVFFAGEPLLDSLCLRWRNNFAAKSSIVNLYGPTETTLAKCCFPVPEIPLPGVQPVGWPLPDTQALILNKAGALCGIGEPGEIVIRTPLRTLGYINAPEEHRRRFLPNPFSTDPLDLVYRTGDNGRYRPDGAVDILGRQDDQVKIHGVRVELGEVTAALMEHPQVKSAVVTVRKEDGNPYLAAYAVTSPGVKVEVDELRYHMAERLPLAMVPSRYTFLDRLPLSANGKVDRSALPEPEVPSKATGRSNQPRDVVEAKLIQIWQKLLRAPDVGIHDDFFLLGGHSMLAVQMFIQIEETFGVNLPLTSLFQKSNIEYLAELINKQRGPSTWSSLVHIRPSSNRPPIFCVHGLTGDVFWFGRLVPYMNPDQPLWGLQSQGLDGVQEPLATIEEMARLYIHEMKSIQAEGPYYICGYSFGGSLAYEMACQLEQQGDEVGLLAIIDHANAKSGYYQVKLGTAFFIALLQNLPRRANDLFNLKPYQIYARIQRKLRTSIKLLAKIPRTRARFVADAGDLVDHASHMPAHIQRVIEANFHAARAYTPGTYRGTLTLLRASGGRLLVSHDPQMGWGKFARNVKIRIVPGSHLSLFEPHRVQFLAQALQTCLDEARNRSEKGTQ